VNRTGYQKNIGSVCPFKKKKYKDVYQRKKSGRIFIKTVNDDYFWMMDLLVISSSFIRLVFCIFCNKQISLSYQEKKFRNSKKSDCAREEQVIANKPSAISLS